VIKLQKTVYDPLFLRNPSRPICTGPRQDDGSSTWSFPSTLTWALFGDDIKVVEHRFTSDQGLGEGAQIFHALSTEGKGSHIPAGLVLRGLQKEVPLSRQVQPFTTNRRKSLSMISDSLSLSFLPGPSFSVCYKAGGRSAVAHG